MHPFSFSLAPGVELSWTASWEGILGGSEAPTTFTAGEKLANLKKEGKCKFFGGTYYILCREKRFILRKGVKKNLLTPTYP